MKINFLEIAQIELNDAIDYYNYESAGTEHQLEEGCSFRYASFAPLKPG